jgi:hypothetical protein
MTPYVILTSILDLSNAQKPNYFSQGGGVVVIVL